LFSVIDERRPDTPYVFKAASLDEAESWLRILYLAVNWGVSEWVVMEKASRSLLVSACSPSDTQTVPILSVAEIDGSGWTVDGSMRLTEWVVEKDLSGIHKGTLHINPKRQINLDLSGVGLSCILTSSIIRVTEGEIWVVVGDRFALVGLKTSALYCSLSQRYLLSSGMVHCGFISRDGEGEFHEDPSHPPPSSNSLIQLAIDVTTRHPVTSEEIVEVWASDSVGDIIIWSSNCDVLHSITIGNTKSVVCAMAQVGDEVSHILLSLSLSPPPFCVFSHAFILRFGVRVTLGKCHAYPSPLEKLCLLRNVNHHV
jgi:hypothetical protein